MLHDRRSVAEMLTDLRKREGVTQAKLAEQLGVSQSWVSQIENKGPSSIEQMCDYLHALGISWRISKWVDPINPDQFASSNKGPKDAKGLLYGPR